jgi:hypothetical protein
MAFSLGKKKHMAMEMEIKIDFAGEDQNELLSASCATGSFSRNIPFHVVSESLRVPRTTCSPLPPHNIYNTE